MSLKRILSAGFAVSVLASSAWAAPSIVAVPRTYAAANGGIRWEVMVTTDDPAYAGSLSIELPLTITSHTSTPAYISFLKDAGGDDTNNTAATSWYYNETGSGSGTLVWNITDAPANAADHTQNVGLNPFTATETEGLQIDTANKRLFAALGSTVGLADAMTDATNFPGKQVRVLHVVTSDGILSWNNAIIGENGVQYSGISGSANSIVPGDFSANGNRNQGAANDLTYVRTGALQDPTTLADLSGFTGALGTGCATFQTANPGLNCEKRGDFDNTGNTTLGDLGGFTAALASTSSGAGGESIVSGSEAPEPASFLLFVLGGVLVCLRRSRR